MKLEYVAIKCDCRKKDKTTVMVHPGGHGNSCLNCDRVYAFEIDEEDEVGIVLRVIETT